MNRASVELLKIAGWLEEGGFEEPASSFESYVGDRLEQIAYHRKDGFPFHHLLGLAHAPTVLKNVAQDFPKLKIPHRIDKRQGCVNTGPGTWGV